VKLQTTEAELHYDQSGSGPDIVWLAGGDIAPLADIEKEVIALALDHYDGQMSKVARKLGIGRSTLYRKVAEYGLEE